MSLELVDARTKITRETDAVLEAHSQAHGVDRSELMRDVLHKWSLSEIRAATLIHRALAREGLPGADEGTQGNSPVRPIRA